MIESSPLLKVLVPFFGLFAILVVVWIHIFLEKKIKFPKTISGTVKKMEGTIVIVFIYIFASQTWNEINSELPERFQNQKMTLVYVIIFLVAIFSSIILIRLPRMGRKRKKTF